jgi:hypothetical protein
MFALVQQESCCLSQMFILNMSDAYLQCDYKRNSAVCDVNWLDLKPASLKFVERN